MVEIASVHEVNVLPPVPVEIRHADARPKLFTVNRDALVTLEMHELDARRCGHIRKLDRLGVLRTEVRRQNPGREQEQGKPMRTILGRGPMRESMSVAG